MTSGLTFALSNTFDFGVESWACQGPVDTCDPHHGDMDCTEAIPVLCARDGTAPNPADYGYWTSGDVRATPDVEGCVLGELADANLICASVFGSDWRMAEFHDGTGWKFRAYGPSGAAFGDRAWLEIDDQTAECWD